MFQPTSEPLQQTFVVMSPDSEKKTHTKILKKFHMIWVFFKYVKNKVVVSYFYKCFYKIYIQKNMLIMKLKKNYLTIRISITLKKFKKILMTFISLNVWFFWFLNDNFFSPKSNNFNFDNGLRYVILFFPTIDNFFYKYTYFYSFEMSNVHFFL